MPTTSITLLERLRRPDVPDAWDRFVELYTPLLFAWARQAGLQDADAADLVQDVFGVLVRQMPTFVYDQRKSFRAWLQTIALNQWRARLRRKKLPIASGADAAVEIVDPNEAFWEEEYRQHVAARALAVMRQEFAPATWQACWETVVNERPAGEVGAELGLSPGAVRAAKFRVLARLRQELDGLLKVMQPALAADRTSRDRFLREARAAAKLAHDHVVTIHQVGEANGAPFLAMQLLQGKSLDAYLAGGGKLSPGQACRIARETALGLARGQSLDGRCDLWSLGVVPAIVGRGDTSGIPTSGDQGAGSGNFRRNGTTVRDASQPSRKSQSSDPTGRMENRRRRVGPNESGERLHPARLRRP